MNFNDLYPSSYIKAADLQGRPFTVRIASLAIEEMSDGEKKPVLRFENSEKGLVLNKTNGSMLASCYGQETDGWVGQPIEIYPDKVPFNGKIVDAVRVRAPQQPVQQQKVQQNPVQQNPEQQPQEAYVEGVDFGDDIPF